MKEKSTFTKYVVVILPVLFVWVGFDFNRDNYPNDPEYIYLVNALCICDGQSVGHIDNPGTTLMQLGAGTIGIMHLFSNPNNETIVEHVLKDPNKFIDGIRQVIIVLNSLLLLFLGLFTVKKTGSVWWALLLQISTVLSTYILDVTWAKLSPEPLLFFISGIYVILLLRHYHSEDKNKWQHLILFSLITGAGLGTKATFLPLSILPLFIFPSIKKKFFYIIGVIPAFILFTIPAIPEYKSMFIWFKNMIGHSGIYGHGQKGIIDTSTYFPNIKSILLNNPSIIIILVLGVFVSISGYLSKSRKEVSWDLKYLIGFLSTYIFGTLLVAKHYGGDHYLIPVILLSGIAFYITINAFDKVFKTKTLNHYLLPGIVIISIGFIAWNHPKKIKISNQQYKSASEEISRTDIWVNKNYEDYTKINYYIYSINKFTGLRFGNDFAKRKILAHLKMILPNTYFYEFSSDSYTNWNLATTLHDVIRNNGNKILLMNGPANPSEIAEMEKRGFPLKRIYEGEAQNIYELDTLKYSPPPKTKTIQVASTIHFGAEQFSADKKFFLGSNSEVFGPINALSKKEVRNGSYSIKLEKSNPFALDYSLNETKEGDQYQIEVWRKSNTSSGYLVISADDSDTFYRAQNEAIRYDNAGWDLLRTDIVIDSKIAEKKLKIYLWNPRRRVAYFDDLTIKKIINK